MSVEMRRIAVLLVVSDHFRCFRSSSSKQTENVSSFWSSSRMVLMFETRFLPLLHLCEVSENCFIRLGHDWNNFYENIDLFQKRSLYIPVWLSWFRCIYLTWTRNMTICGLSLHHGNTESRKNFEQKLIFQLGTLSPHGINERFSFH